MTQKPQPEQARRPLSTTVLVVGEGETALFAAGEIAEGGYGGVVLLNPVGRFPREMQASDSKGRIEIWEAASIIELEGFPGAFHVLARLENGSHAEAEVGAVIVASDCRMQPPFPAWRLEESERILSLSRLEEALSSGTGGTSGDVETPRIHVLVCGFAHTSHPLSQRRGMEAAIQLAAGDRSRVIFLLEHFKVADAGLERLSRKAREAGVLFVKLTGSAPVIERQGDGIRVSYDDMALGDRVFLHPDRVVLEEAYAPAPYMAQLAAVLGIHTDPQGYLQGDNVYNQPIFTNRTGIWVVGQAKGPVPHRQCLQEAQAAAHEAAQLLGTGKTGFSEDRILLDTRKCTICLTCYRLCPHRAISYVNRRPVFSNLACRACGICVAECPMDAIQLNGHSDASMNARIREWAARVAMAGARAGDAIVAFCCRNSAYEAAMGAAAMGADIPKGLELFPVPCAGNVGPDDILKAFRHGAAGVMVLACHHESCKSVTGSRIARWRVQAVGHMLKEAGVSPGRVFFGTLAPATPMDFVAAVREMGRRVKKMNHDE